MSTTNSKHFITLDKAKKMTKKFRGDKRRVVKDEYHGKGILPTCETFERGAFDVLLAQPGCVGVRCYYAMDDEMKVHLVIVGVNGKDEDILPAQTDSLSKELSIDATETQAVILDNSIRCPVECPPPSTLNTE